MWQRVLWWLLNTLFSASWFCEDGLYDPPPKKNTWQNSFILYMQKYNLFLYLFFYAIWTYFCEIHLQGRVRFYSIVGPNIGSIVFPYIITNRNVVGTSYQSLILQRHILMPEHPCCVIWQIILLQCINNKANATPDLVHDTLLQQVPCFHRGLFLSIYSWGACLN